MSAPPTLSKLSTETVPVSDIVIGDGTCVKVGHLNSLDLQCTLQKGKRNYIFTESLNLQFYTRYKAVNFFHLCLMYPITS